MQSIAIRGQPMLLMNSWYVQLFDPQVRGDSCWMVLYLSRPDYSSLFFFTTGFIRPSWNPLRTARGLLSWTPVAYIAWNWFGLHAMSWLLAFIAILDVTPCCPILIDSRTNLLYASSPYVATYSGESECSWQNGVPQMPKHSIGYVISSGLAKRAAWRFV